MEQVSTQSEVRIFDRDGKELILPNGYADLSPRTLQNIPWAQLFPDEPVVLIDWMAGHRQRPKVEDLREGVEVDGVRYLPFGHGTGSVKRGLSLGFTRDIMRQLGLVKLVRDGCRAQRAFFYEGLWGAGRGELEVVIVPPGTVVDGNLLEDGNALMGEELGAVLWNGRTKVHLKDCMDSYQVQQRIPMTDAIRKAVTPLIEERLQRLSPEEFTVAEPGVLEGSKKRWLDKHPELVFHPFFASTKAIARKWGKLLFTWATTYPTDAQIRVAVPSFCPKMALPTRSVGWRYPVKNNSAIADMEAFDDEEEMRRIADMEAAQFTLISVEDEGFFASGVFNIVSSIKGHRIIMCSDNIKLAVGDLDEAKKPRTVVLKDAVISLGQWWDKGSLIGVNVPWGKQCMALDVDGDFACYFEVRNPKRDLTAVADEVANLPTMNGPKIEKDDTPWDWELYLEFLLDSMGPGVGVGANVMSSSFMVTDREEFAIKAGFNNERSMDYIMDRWIQAFVDIPKAYLAHWNRRNADGEIEHVVRSMDDILKQDVAPVQKTIVTKYGSLAPWTEWRRNPMAFSLRLPVCIEDERTVTEVDKKVRLFKIVGLSGWEELTDDDMRIAVWPFMDGTIAEICRMTLHRLRPLAEMVVKALPLNSYYDWAPPVSHDLFVRAVDLRDRYAARAKIIRRTDPAQFHSTNLWAAKEFNKAVREMGCTRTEFGYALWRTVHNRRTTFSGSAVAFYAAEDVADHIVEDKPGLWGGQLEVVITGMKYNINAGPRLPWSGDVDLRRVWVQGKDDIQPTGRTVVIPVDTAGWVFKPKPVKSPYPDDMIGVLPKDKPGVETGCYRAELSKISDAAWRCRLTPLA